MLGGFIRVMVCNSGEEGECEWGAGCASPTHHQPIHTSISLPSGGSVRREKEETKEAPPRPDAPPRLTAAAHNPERRQHRSTGQASDFRTYETFS
mgnify:CR=1 FL=1